MMSIYHLTRQNITSHVDNSEALMLKAKNDIADHFIYQHSYHIDKKPAINQVLYINIMKSENYNSCLVAKDYFNGTIFSLSTFSYF